MRIPAILLCITLYPSTAPAQQVIDVDCDGCKANTAQQIRIDERICQYEIDRADMGSTPPPYIARSPAMAALGSAMLANNRRDELMISCMASRGWIPRSWRK